MEQTQSTKKLKVAIRRNPFGIEVTRTELVDTVAPPSIAASDSSHDLRPRKGHPYLKELSAHFGIALYVVLFIPAIFSGAIINSEGLSRSISIVYGHLVVDPVVAFAILAVLVLMAFTLSAGFSVSGVVRDDLDRYSARRAALVVVGVCCHIMALTQVAYLVFGFARSLAETQITVAILAIICAETAAVMTIWREKEAELELVLSMRAIERLEKLDREATAVWETHWVQPQGKAPGLVMRSFQFVGVVIVLILLEVLVMRLLVWAGFWADTDTWWQTLVIGVFLVVVLTVVPVLFVMWSVVAWLRADLGKLRIVMALLIVALPIYTVVSFVLTFTIWQEPLREILLYMLPLVAAATLIWPLPFPLWSARLLTSGRGWRIPLYVTQEMLRIVAKRSEQKRQASDQKRIAKLRARYEEMKHL